ncbi:class I SAM-dependent methyltransferase [Salinisphaera sp. Q1T1-3]|uniref:class I SAM-dependent methyltransferase n=1 Tax=Salinisphaera sp. Q1T1-3 TaxID=2321229 RepID=UPI000E717BBB|nr:hypothetical protein [Salinisphaera sp. Q1T1-3]RJS91274.1 hypothetical protein D3260_16070 [Salinisphaera sp. Q1T1-3]
MNTRTAPSLSDFTTLWRLWLTKPRQIATWAPSSAAVGAAFVDAATAAPDGLIVELGAGTGPITATLLAAGLDRNRLIAVEADHILHARLCRRFGPAGMLCLDARALAPTIARLLRRRGHEHVGAILSTLPILNFDTPDQRAVLDGCFTHAASSACFTQITYLPGSPVRRHRLERWGYSATRWRRIQRNWPPATLWQYRREP